MQTLNDHAISTTVAWLERVVIGLNLCPFAKAVHAKKQVHFVVSNAFKADALLVDLKRELCLLMETDPEKVESTLLIHPNVLNDFVEYNHFLVLCDFALEAMKLDGIVQIASFHPNYQFADVEFDDVTNYTNRSPFPTLHLLREESVTRAVQTFPDGDGIYERNIATLNKLGKAGMDDLISDLNPVRAK